MIKKIFILFLGLILYWSCDDIVADRTNPGDKGNPDYKPPTVILISAPVEGETIDEFEITLSWSGNEKVTEYRWKFDYGEWIDWVNITSVEWQYLDEGQHSFSLQSRYTTGDTSSILTRSFIVDAVDGPALMFYPRAHFVSSDTVVTFQILAEEVMNLAALEFSINYEPDRVEITSVTKGAIFAANEESIFYADYDSSLGTLLVLAAILGGSEPSMSGTGVLVEIRMNVISTDSSQLTFTGAEAFKDPENNDVIFIETVNGLVVVE